MSKKTKSSAASCGRKTTKKKPVVERGLFNWIGDANRWFIISMRVYHAYEVIKSLMDSVGSG